MSNETTPNSEGTNFFTSGTDMSAVGRLSEITGAYDPDSFSVFLPRIRRNGRVYKTALEAAREYEQAVTNDDTQRFAEFTYSHADAPEVATWLDSLPPDERKELGL